jgi:hypothetical protein
MKFNKLVIYSVYNMKCSIYNNKKPGIYNYRVSNIKHGVMVKSLAVSYLRVIFLNEYKSI